MRTLGIIIVAMALCGQAWAGPIEDSLAAINRGDYGTARRLIFPLADQGDAHAQNNLGNMYLFGQGVPMDYAEAMKWYRLAADQGNAAAQTALGLLASPQPTPSLSTTRKIIPLENDHGTFVVPVVINGVITLKFTVDSGSADVSIPSDVVSTLVRTGTIADNDFLGKQTYVLADGSKIPSQTFRIRSLKVGDVVMEDVMGSVAPTSGSLLLGQSFLSRLKSWSMDNQRHALIIE